MNCAITSVSPGLSSHAVSLTCALSLLTATESRAKPLGDGLVLSVYLIPSFYTLPKESLGSVRATCAFM